MSLVGGGGGGCYFPLGELFKKAWDGNGDGEKDKVDGWKEKMLRVNRFA